MAFTTTLLEKYREEDNVITKVQYDFTGEVNESLEVIIYHFRPTDAQHVIDNIYGRGQSEELKLITQKNIDTFLPDIIL
jgi:hypothetical protein